MEGFMKSIINRLPIAPIKMFFGRMLYRLVHLIYRQDIQLIVRDGIRYEADLSEGIELSMFLFGSFQKHVSRIKYLALPPDAVIFDVGANSGMISLQFAKQVPLGKVYAFEPTFYAFRKLQKNLELNTELAGRIVAIQRFVSANTSAESVIKAYSSWKVGGTVKGEVHQVHGGIVKPSEGIGAVSLDDFCEQSGIKRVDFIKIDTDGHEYAVLTGARKIIGKFRPAIIFEAGIYLMNENSVDFSDYWKFFKSSDYSLFNSSNFKKINADSYDKYIPLKGTIDILAMPNTETGERGK